MMQKASCSIDDMPHCYCRLSIQFPGNTGRKIDYLNPGLSKIIRRVAAIRSLRFALFVRESSQSPMPFRVLQCRHYHMCSGHISYCSGSFYYVYDVSWVTWRSYTVALLYSLCQYVARRPLFMINHRSSIVDLANVCIQPRCFILQERMVL